MYYVFCQYSVIHSQYLNSAPSKSTFKNHWWCKFYTQNDQSVKGRKQQNTLFVTVL